MFAVTTRVPGNEEPSVLTWCWRQSPACGGAHPILCWGWGAVATVCIDGAGQKVRDEPKPLWDGFCGRGKLGLLSWEKRRKDWKSVVTDV